MITSLNPLFLYNDIRRLLLRDGYICSITKDNAPMNKRSIKVHKGLDNNIMFRAFDPDRNPTNVCTYSIYGRIFNTENSELVLEKLCRTTTAIGMVILDLDEGDLANISPGLYDLVIVGQKNLVPQTVGEVTTTPFYTDYDSNIVATLEITPQAERVPTPSYEITEDDWTFGRLLKNGTGPIIDQFYSSAIPAGRVSNHINNTHSFSVFTDIDNKFTGSLEILGTLELTPSADPNSHDWFRIQVVTGSNILEFIDFFGTEAFSFSSNMMFMKFRYTLSPDVIEPGKIMKIILRS